MLGMLSNWKNEASTTEVVEQLDKLYCSNVGIEFMHVESFEEREWIANEYERLSSHKLEPNEKLEIAKVMLISQNFDKLIRNLVLHSSSHKTFKT